MPVPVDRFVSYRGSVALNNMGVSLLEKGKTKQALCTFKSSLQVLHLNECDHVDSVDLRVSIEHHIQLAMAWLMNHDTEDEVGKRSFASRPKVRPLAYSPGQNLEVGGLDAECTSLPGFPLIMPVRIDLEDHDIEQMPFDREVELQAGLILLNLGVTHVFIARMAEGEYVYRALNCAAKVFRLARAILGSIYYNIMADIPSSHFMMVACQAEFMILDNLIPLLRACGEDEEEMACRQRLASLLPTIRSRLAIEKLCALRYASAA